jgi:hypothetical protein
VHLQFTLCIQDFTVCILNGAVIMPGSPRNSKTSQMTGQPPGCHMQYVWVCRLPCLLHLTRLIALSVVVHCMADATGFVSCAAAVSVADAVGHCLLPLETVRALGSSSNKTRGSSSYITPQQAA